MTSLDFSYRTLVALPLISLINLDLKIRVLPCLTGSYYSKLNTFLPIRLSIFYLSNILNGVPGIIILPYFRNSRKSSWSARFLPVINNIKKIGFIVFDMAYLIFQFFRSFSSSFDKLMYHDHKMLYDRLFFYINRLVSIVVGKFYAFDFFFFLRYFGKR
jgi:hypothetical protein